MSYAVATPSFDGAPVQLPKQRRGKGRREEPVGCVLKAPVDLGRGGPCLRSNPAPQTHIHAAHAGTETPGLDMSPAMIVLRGALLHLRSVGLLPHVLDLAFTSAHVALTVAPARLHRHFAGHGTSTVRLYPTLATPHFVASCELLRFDAAVAEEARDLDIVLAFAFNSASSMTTRAPSRFEDTTGAARALGVDTSAVFVRDHPWEPAFFEGNCCFRCFAGPRPFLDSARFLSADFERHRAAFHVARIAASHDGPPEHRPHCQDTRPTRAAKRGSSSAATTPRSSSAAAGPTPAHALPFADTAAVQEPYRAMDAATTELGRQGFEAVRWERLAAQLNTSVYVAVHRILYARSIGCY